MDPALDVTLRAALALLFGVAAAHKLRDVRRFRATLAEYRVFPATLTSTISGLVVAAELGVAGALVLPARPAAGPLGAALLLVLYGAAIGVNLARGRRDLDCGCAGPALRRPIGGWMVARNLVLAAAALAALVPLRTRPLVWVDVVTVSGATLVLAALYAAVERLVVQAPALARLRAGT